MATITKKELVGRIVSSTHVKKPFAKNILLQFSDDTVAVPSRDNRIEFPDFGVFEVKKLSVRTVQNHKILEKVKMPAKRIVNFKTDRLMKEKSNSQVSD